MSRKLAASVLILAASLVAALSLRAQNGTSGNSREELRIAKQVRHEIVIEPYLNVFDSVNFNVDGPNVTLTGAVTQPTVKNDIVKSVKRIEGVQHVDDQIKVLPPSPADQRIRRALFRSIYRYPPLQKYAGPVVKPIQIIVDSGHVTLEGVVDSESDKNLVQLRANSVPGIFSVTDNLQVVKP